MSETVPHEKKSKSKSKDKEGRTHKKSHRHRTDDDGVKGYSEKTPATGASPPPAQRVEEDWEANQALVEQLVGIPPNNICNDCGESGTRWAVANWGVFVCIRCSGIHRSLGVHISKVKSTNMDKWTRSEVRLMELIGNARGKELYEERVGAVDRPPGGLHSESDLRQFIVQKYAETAFAVSKVKSIVRRIQKEAQSSAAELMAKADGAPSAVDAATGSPTAVLSPSELKAQRLSMMQAMYGDKANPRQRSNKEDGGRASTKGPTRIHGVFGVVNVNASDYDSRLAHVFSAFGVAPIAAAEEGSPLPEEDEESAEPEAAQSPELALGEAVMAAE